MRLTTGAVRLTGRLLPALIWIACPAAFAGTGALPPGVLAVTPVDGAQLVRPETGIQLRFDHPLSAQAVRSVRLSVTGSLSGPHPGRLHLSDDRMVLLFDPAVPFVPGETVRTELGGGIDGAPDPGRAPSRTGFAVSRSSLPRATLRSEFDWPRPGLAPLRAAVPPRLPPAAAADTLPAGFPAIVSSTRDSTAPGDLFLANLGLSAPTTPFLLVLRNDGTPVWCREVPGSGTDFKRQANGQYTYYDDSDRKVHAMDSEFHEIGTWDCGNGYSADPHDCLLLPGGHALLLSPDREVVDMSQVVAGGDSAAQVDGLVIQEVDASRNVVFQWRSWDHFQVTDATHEDLTAHYIDYVHGNSIDLDTDGNLLLSSRHMDEVTKIDRTTGEMIWRWGGFHNQFTFIGDSLQFSHQHAVRRIANGDVTLFDNGNFHEPSFSRACEYRLDEVNHTATMVWEYAGDSTSYGFAMGYVQRLANGNTLIGYGAGKPDVREVGPDGTVKFELSFPPGVSSYRAYRFDIDSLSGGSPGAPPPHLALLTQNPVRGPTVLLASLPNRGPVSMEVYDVQCRLVRRLIDHEEHAAGVLSEPLDLSGRSAGVYFCRLAAAGQVATRRLVYAP